MNVYFSLALIAVIPVIVSLILYYLFHQTKLKDLSYWPKQIIIGVIFGVIAICGTEFGVPFQGAVINARDAAPLCAGLIFGGPAGVIAGVIGGVERWFAVYWGAGYYTRLGCTISTIMTGIIAAVLRTHMFGNRLPAWDQTLLIGVVCEVLHMLSIFFTNIADVRSAFMYVEMCTIPMVTVNAAAVTIAVAVIQLVRLKRNPERRTELPSVSDRFQRTLLVEVLIGFVVAMLFTFFLQRSITSEDTEKLLRQSLDDAVQEVQDRCEDTLLHVNRLVADTLTSNPDADLSVLKDQYHVSEINLIDSNGVITASTMADYVGYDMKKGEMRQREYLNLLNVNGPTELVQMYVRSAADNSIMMHYSGVKTPNGIIQVAFNEAQRQEEMTLQLQSVVTNRHVGETGILVVMDQDRNLVSATRLDTEEDLEMVDLDLNGTKEHTVYVCRISGEDYYYMYTHSEGYRIFGFLPASEADFSGLLSIYLNFLTQGAIFGILFAAVYIITRQLIVRDIWRIDRSLSKISEGNLDTVVDVHSSSEFDSLSKNINTTVDTLKRYIAEANERIDSELRYASEIQSSALPSIFPDREEFDLYALMDPAKEIGGDFYDFYMISGDVLAFIVADVSGKGIPAALFMMRAMTTIHAYAQNNVAVADIFTNANYQLCEGNDAGLFVTAWMGFLNLKTGELKYANAGHNHPLIRRKNGTFEYLKGPAGLVLGGMEGIAYKEQQLTMEPGDELFLYTDGVVEATNKDEELYGDDRLRDCLNAHVGEDAKKICLSVKQDVDRFYEGAPQFDDLTELSFQFRKRQED